MVLQRWSPRRGVFGAMRPVLHRGQSLVGATDSSATTCTLTTTSVRAACTLSDLAVSCHVISGLHYIYIKKKSKSIFDTRAVFFTPGIKAQRDEGGGRIKLGDNTDGRAVMLWPMKFYCVGVCISARFPCTYVYSLAHAYPIPTCLQTSGM